MLVLVVLIVPSGTTAIVCPLLLLMIYDIVYSELVYLAVHRVLVNSLLGLDYGTTIY